MPRGDTAVVSPNLGLYLGRSPLLVPPRGLQAGFNFRINNGNLDNLSIGWSLYSAIDFGNPVTLIDTFFIRGVAEKQIIGTITDLFDYSPETDTAVYINPIYATGTVSVGGNDTFTKILLHGDGTDTSTTITDSNSGGSAHTWTARGNAQIDTAIKKFGTAAILFDGTGDYVDTPDHADFNLGTSNWAFDIWFNCTAASGTVQRIAGQVDVGVTAAGSSFGLTREATDVIAAFVSNGTTFVGLVGTTTFTNAVNTGWNHAAVVRNGNTITLYINGVQEATSAFASTIPNSAELFGVGSWGGSVAAPWTGSLDEARLSVGTPRWTTAFTPPVAAYASALIVTGVGTTWAAPAVKPGDMIYFGSATQTSISVTWYEIATVDSTTQLTLVTAPTLPPTAATYTIRSLFTGTVNDVWRTATFVNPDDGTGDDLWFATNGVEYVMTWDGSAAQVVRRSALAFTCKELCVYKNMMFYANINEDGGDFLPTTFVNSDVGNPLNISTGLAGQFRVHDGVEHIQALKKLGDNLTIYSSLRLTLAQFIGDPILFIFRDVTSGVGALAQRMVADFGDYHLFLHKDSQYLFDGTTVTEVGKQLWREVLSQRDPTRFTLAFTHLDEEAGELHWVVPLTADAGSGVETAAAETAYVEHYLEEVGDRVPSPFSSRSSPWLCGGFGITQGALTFDEVTEAWEDVTFRWNDSFLFAAFPLSLMGSADGHVYKINTLQSANGTALPSFARFGRRSLGDGRMRGLLARVYPFSEETNTDLSVTSRFSDHAEGTVTITDTQTFDGNLVEGEHFVSPFRRGRYFELEFGTDGGPWAISGYDTDVKRGGLR